MAMAQQMSDTGPQPEYCNNAREYVVERLNSEDPVAPAELAEEYGCTANHMRKTLASLVDENEAERVSRGQYAAPDSDSNGETDEDVEIPAGENTEANDESMPTQEEYKRQHRHFSLHNDDESAGDDVESSEPVEDGEAGSSSEAGPVPLPAEPKKLGMILAAAVILWLLYRSFGGVQTDVETSEIEEGGGDQDGGGDDLGGGLLQ